MGLKVPGRMKLRCFSALQRAEIAEINSGM